MLKFILRHNIILLLWCTMIGTFLFSNSFFATFIGNEAFFEFHLACWWLQVPCSWWPCFIDTLLVETSFLCYALISSMFSSHLFFLCTVFFNQDCEISAISSLSNSSRWLILWLVRCRAIVLFGCCFIGLLPSFSFHVQGTSASHQIGFRGLLFRLLSQ